MWAKYKAVILIIITTSVTLSLTYYGYQTGALSQFEFARLMFLTAFIFYIACVSMMVIVIKYKELCGLERNLNIETLGLSRKLIEQIEELMADNKALIQENHRLEKNNIHPIRERKHD